MVNKRFWKNFVLGAVIGLLYCAIFWGVPLWTEGKYSPPFLDRVLLIHGIFGGIVALSFGLNALLLWWKSND